MVLLCGKHQWFKPNEGDFGKTVVETQQWGDVGEHEEIENKSGSDCRGQIARRGRPARREMQ